jgi:hypothetical protein
MNEARALVRGTFLVSLSEHLRSALRIVIELNAKVECKGLLGKYQLIDSHDAIDLTDLSKSDVFTQFKRRRSGVKNLFFLHFHHFLSMKKKKSIGHRFNFTVDKASRVPWANRRSI